MSVITLKTVNPKTHERGEDVTVHAESIQAIGSRVLSMKSGNSEIYLAKVAVSGRIGTLSVILLERDENDKISIDLENDMKNADNKLVPFGSPMGPMLVNPKSKVTCSPASDENFSGGPQTRQAHINFIGGRRLLVHGSRKSVNHALNPSKPGTLLYGKKYPIGGYKHK
jgi:hypothetical protein